MKRLLILAVLGAVLTALTVLVSGPSLASGNAKKVDICHVTGSETNPVVLITVAASAVPALLAHGDFYAHQNAVSVTCIRNGNHF